MSKDNVPNHAELRGHNAPPSDLHTHNGPAKRLYEPEDHAVKTLKYFWTTVVLVVLVSAAFYAYQQIPVGWTPSELFR